MQMIKVLGTRHEIRHESVHVLHGGEITKASMLHGLTTHPFIQKFMQLDILKLRRRYAASKASLCLIGIMEGLVHHIVRL